MNRRGLLPLLLFVGLAAAQERKSEVLQVGRIAKSIRLRLQLGEGGSVRVESDLTWRSMALVDVVRHIGLAKTSFNELERAEGRSGYDRGPGGIEASRLPVELDVHPDTPWQHVCWLMTVLREERIYRLRLVVSNRSVDLYLPRDSSAPSTQPKTRVSVKVVAKQFAEGRWGDQAVMKAASVEYCVDGRLLVEPREVALRLAEFRKAAGSKGAGVVSADPSVPTSKCFEVLDLFLQAGVNYLDFVGREIPSKEERRAQPLPHPRKKD